MIFSNNSSLRTDCVREQLTKEAVADWEEWSSTIAPQSDSADEYCDPSGCSPLFIPLEEFLPQSPDFDRRCGRSEAIVAKAQTARGTMELQRYRTGYTPFSACL